MTRGITSRMALACAALLSSTLSGRAPASSPRQTSTRTYSVDEITATERRRADRERAEWNARVDAKKLERHRRRLADKWGV